MKSKVVCLVVGCMFSMVPWLQAHTPGTDEREHIQQDNSSQYNLEARGYNPQAGRFTSVDPKREFVNPYSYTGNNPVMFVDPDGQMKFTATHNEGNGLSFIDVKFETYYDEHLKSRADSVTSFVPLPGPVGAVVTVVQEASRFLKGTSYLPYANIKWVPGSDAITGPMDQAKFESRVLERFKALMPEKNHIRNEFTFIDGDPGLKNVATAILATLVEMEAKGDLEEGSAVTIFQEFGFEDVLKEARKDDTFLSDIKNFFIDEATGKAADVATDVAWDKAQEIINK